MVNSMDLLRLFRHLSYPDWLTYLALPRQAMRRIEEAVKDSETRHTGEIRFAVEGSLHLLPLLARQSARDRAIEVFSRERVWDTEHNNGVLVYLLLAERDVEIVADRGLAGRVPQEEWEGICREMERHFQARRYEEGMIYGIAEVGRRLEVLYPAGGENPNELPDRPIRL
jgi:uncharacterized membrane protein